MSLKTFITEFYTSDALYNPETMERFLHEEVQLEWYSSKGFLTKNRTELLQLAADLSKAYETSHVAIHDVIEEENKVSVRYTHHASTIENPNQFMILAHFMVHWEIQDGKLFHGWQMSQLPT